MDVEIINSIDNQLLERKEVDANVHFKGATPSRKEIKEAVCGKIGANPDIVVLREVNNEYGVQRVKVSVHVYKNAEKMKEVEPEHLIKKETKKEEKKEEKPQEAPAPKEKKPAEEKPKEEKAPEKQEKPEQKKEEKKEDKKE